MKNVNLLILLFAIILLESNPAYPTEPLDIEKILLTDGDTDRKFHLLEGSLSFDYDGFHVGIEKTKREIVLGKNNENIPNVSINELESLTIDPPYSDALRKNINWRMSDPEVMFVSQILSTKKENSIGSHMIYDIYGKDGAKLSNELIKNGDVYKLGWRALESSLRLAVISRVKNAPPHSQYTHLILMSTGWNTTQLESVKAYND